MNLRALKVVFLLIFGFLLDGAEGQALTPDASRSKISFSVNNLGIGVNGTFQDISGKIIFSTDRPENSSFEILIPVQGLETGIQLRDNHLENEAYFDAKHYPNISFKSTRIRKTKSEHFEMTGVLTIKNITTEIVFPFRTVNLANACQFIAELTINRRDFSVGKRSLTMSDDVRIHLNVIASVDHL